ncbi:hypothetical protein Sbal183_3084 [Shewanella baltica OS183]|nr:hypothetical protein Sbal183_3084 [Shewanella baltica OS183]
MKTGLASNCQSRFFNTNVDPLQKSWTHTAIKHAAVKKIAALIASYLNAKSSFLTISAPALKALSLPLAT